MAHCVWKVPLGSGNHVVGELFIRSRSKRHVLFEMDRVKNEYSRESARLVLQFNTTHVDFIDLKWPNIDTPSVPRGITFQVVIFYDLESSIGISQIDPNSFFIDSFFMNVQNESDFHPA